jgi:hypothetical protein
MDEVGRVRDGGTMRAVSVMFNSILNGVESREKQLIASIQEVKDVLESN